ncbi:conserved hypothetical protein [Vibrio chagasii]|nr:hypothetical protein AOG25_08705 [Vibrio alginolyticus]CAH7147352.1 conserved hypothetical protein [Vibrio chagasii]CAH7318270.1 conserved hypothetical protein [Vibrio chagasii]
MDVVDIESASDALIAQDSENFWVESGDQVLCLNVDSNFALLLFVALIFPTLDTLVAILCVYLVLLYLKRKDVSFFEMLSQFRGRLLRGRYKR